MVIKNRAKLFIENFLFYGLTLAVTKLLGFIMLIIYSNNFSPSSFGIYDLSTTFFGLIGTLGLLGMGPAMFRIYYDNDSLEWKRQSIYTAIFITFCATLALCFLLIIFTNIIGPAYWKTQNFKPYYIAGTINLFFGNLSSLLVTTLYRRNARRDIIITMLLGSFISFTLGYYFFVIEQKEPIYMYYISTFVFVIELIYALFANKSLLFGKLVNINWKILKSLLRFGVPAIPTVFLYWIIDAYSRYRINIDLGSEQLGIYSMGAKIAAIMALIQTVFSQSWSYFVYNVMNDQDADIIYGRVFDLISLFCFLLLILIAGYVDVFFELFIGAQFFEGYKIAALLCTGPVFTVLGWIAGVGFNIKKKTEYSMYSLLCSAIITIVFSIILIPKFGIIGAAITAFLSYALSLVFFIFFGRKFFYIKMNIISLVASITLFLIVLALKHLFPSNLLLITVAVLTSFVLIIIFYNQSMRQIYRYVMNFLPQSKKL